MPMEMDCSPFCVINAEGSPQVETGLLEKQRHAWGDQEDSGGRNEEAGMEGLPGGIYRGLLGGIIHYPGGKRFK